MWVVVVLPLVPVIPTTASSAVGSRCRRAAARAIAPRTSSTRTSGTPSPSGRWTTSAAAPRATASAAKSCPSRVKPGTQKNRVPGFDGPVVVGEGDDVNIGPVAEQIAQRHARDTLATAPAAPPGVRPVALPDGAAGVTTAAGGQRNGPDPIQLPGR